MDQDGSSRGGEKLDSGCSWKIGIADGSGVGCREKMGQAQDTRSSV